VQIVYKVKARKSKIPWLPFAYDCRVKDYFKIDKQQMKTRERDAQVVSRLTPSMPKKSDLLVRSSFLILRVELSLLRGSIGIFSSSLRSTGGGGGFSLGGSTLVGGPNGNDSPVMISSSLEKLKGRICGGSSHRYPPIDTSTTAIDYSLQRDH
jgi:hypothetical protein